MVLKKNEAKTKNLRESVSETDSKRPVGHTKEPGSTAAKKNVKGENGKEEREGCGARRHLSQGQCSYTNATGS